VSVDHHELGPAGDAFGMACQARQDVVQRLGLVEIAERLDDDAQGAFVFGAIRDLGDPRHFGLGCAHHIRRPPQLAIAFACRDGQELFFQALENVCVLLGGRFERASDALAGGLRHYAHCSIPVSV
jgi:hypothetical protein